MLLVSNPSIQTFIASWKGRHEACSVGTRQMTTAIHARRFILHIFWNDLRNMGLFKVIFFIFPMENPAFGESTCEYFLFFGNLLSKSKGRLRRFFT